MRQVTTGDTVRVHYQGTLDDGTEFDSSAGRGPLELTIGGGQILPGFEAALMGLSAGDTNSVTLQPGDAYGQHDPQLIHKIERSQVPDEVDLQVGTALGATDSEGNQIRLLVTAIDGDTVTIDANHPLAGKALTFELELVGFV